MSEDAHKESPHLGVLGAVADDVASAPAAFMDEETGSAREVVALLHEGLVQNSLPARDGAKRRRMGENLYADPWNNRQRAEDGEKLPREDDHFVRAELHGEDISVASGPGVDGLEGALRVELPEISQ